MAEQARVYLDHNATTPLAEPVLEAMLPWLKQNFGNASSIHAEGRAARSAIDRARAQVAGLVGAAPEEIVFTGGGTESDNLAVRGAAESRPPSGGSIRLVTSAVEHHAVLRPMQRLERLGCELTSLPVDCFGCLVLDELEKALQGGKPVLVSLIAVSNEVGTLQPVEQAGALCRESEVTFHVDAVQAAGRVPLDVRRLKIDLLSLSAHKIYGPKGVGALYVRRGVEIQPQMLGGGQERRRRSGTENVAGIVGFGAACDLARTEFESRNRLQLELRERLHRGILGRVEGVHLNGHPDKRVSNTLNLSFEGVEGEAILLGLDSRGISASSGSACASGSLEPSHVLTAMGVAPELAQNSVRFSLGRGNTAAEIDRTVEAVADIVQRLRAMQLSS
ncbi:aminotransferase class V-fold PLP-dependent enzyme [bacterium]|nr:aminotransferase class V-fold PLP-dependent enzyme [bacterium]